MAEDNTRAGASEADLGRWMAEYRDRLLRIARFRLDPRLAGRVDPEDVLQEAYLAAAQRRHHFFSDAGQSPLVWLRLILIQTMSDLHRRHLAAQQRDIRREQGPSASPDGTSLSMAARLAGSLTSPSEALQREERGRRLAAALEQMPPLDREILALRHFEELSNREAAEALGIEQKAASIRYVRALKRLRGLLSELFGSSEMTPRERL